MQQVAGSAGRKMNGLIDGVCACWRVVVDWTGERVGG